MKKLLAKAGLVVLSALLVLNIAFADLNYFPYRPDVGTEKVTGDHVNSENDTVYYTRQPGLEALAIAAHWKDSVSLTRVIVRRLVDGDICSPAAGDTIVATTFAGAPVVGDTSLTVAVTLAPLADTYVFIFQYASSNNGVTSPTVVYEAIKQIP